MTAEPAAARGFPSIVEGLASAWLRAWESPANAGAGDGHAGSPLLAQMFDPRRWLGLGGGAIEQPFESFLGLPRLADMPAVDRQLLALAQGWIVLAQRGTEYGGLVGQVWLQAHVDFMGELLSAAAEDRPARSGRELAERWTAAVNARLQVAQRSGDLLAAQGRLMDAMLSQREREREIVEALARVLGQPTRAEMDDVHRSLRAVRRELRALQRERARERETADAARQRQPAGVPADTPAGGNTRKAPARRRVARSKR